MVREKRVPYSKKPIQQLSKPEMLSDLQSLRSKLAKKAQKALDEWQPDAEDFDEMLGGGGACDQICDELAGELAERGYNTRLGGWEGDDHAWLITDNGKHAFAIDIHPSIYETGGGYNWKKIQGAKIRPEDIDIWEVDYFPDKF